tara:strand:+ start:904 stop:1332 length:429 start_codon:yes stop_codon:yes gene_type:complete
MADKKPIKTIVDHIGRTVVGELKKEDTKTITLFNPVIVHVQPDPQSGQLQVQSFPYIFMEFLKDKDKNDWTFNKASISTSNVELDERITQQYANINNPNPPIQQQAQEEPEVIQLFDDEEEETTTTTPSPADACSDTSNSCC